MKIGIGYDIHRLEEGRKLILGGVNIPYIKGLFGHSDADVLLHAVMDALLGAAALGDIGHLFPNTDGRFRGISSIELLKCVRDRVAKAGHKIGNIDATIIAEEPKIEPFRKRMIENVAGALDINAGEVNIKATTQEGVGAIGRGEAIAAYAVALLKE